MLVDDAIEYFISYLVRRRGSTRTTEITYRSILGDFSKRLNCDNTASITICAIDSIIDAYSILGFKPKTLKNKVVVIRSFIKYLYAREYTNIRPERIEIPKIQQDEPNFLTPTEADRLIQSANDVRDRAIIVTLIRSGLRVSELTDLRYDDLFERSIVVRKGKGGKARITFISPDAEQAIYEYLATKCRTEYLFTNLCGNKISRQYIARIVSEYARAAGIEKHVSPHTLRHTFATGLLHNGARIEDVQPMMGHANINTTRIYMHFTNEYLHQRYDQFITK